MTFDFSHRYLTKVRRVAVLSLVVWAAAFGFAVWADWKVGVAILLAGWGNNLDTWLRNYRERAAVARSFAQARGRG
jgi:hypothetical protein